MDKDKSLYNLYENVKPILKSIIEWFEEYYWAEMSNDSMITSLITKLQNDNIDLYDRMDIIHQIIEICMAKRITAANKKDAV